MKKKAISIILMSILVTGIVGCSNGENIINDKVNQPRVASEIPITPMEQQEDLAGTWSQNYSREQVTDLFNEGLIRVESTANGYELEYTKSEEVKEENDVSVNDNSIYSDNENPEKNRLESMYYGFRQYGSDLASGQIIMKLGFNLDKEMILENGYFDFGELSLSSFSQAFTGNYDRDYAELNKQIYDIIDGKDGVTTIENNLDGIRETVTITDNYLLYKLETKVYSFK